MIWTLQSPLKLSPIHQTTGKFPEFSQAGYSAPDEISNKNTKNYNKNYKLTVTQITRDEIPLYIHCDVAY